MGTQAVRILGRDYAVKVLKRLKNDGECHYPSATIRVAERLDAHERKDCLLHEVMHAVLYQQGREHGGDTEETYVRALATGLIAVFQENPDLAAYLSSKETP